jgi:hypothetical protein
MSAEHAPRILVAPSTLVLPLYHIGEADRLDPESFPEVDVFTEADQARFEREGWECYRPGDFLTRPLPELGPPLHYSGRFSIHGGGRSPGLVVPLGGWSYRVELAETRPGREPWECDGLKLVLTATGGPPTPPDCPPPRDKGIYSHEYQFFGQPRWVQGPIYAAWEGQALRNFLTIENEWGDCGNTNILVAVGDDGRPTRAFFEASCC